MSIELFEPTQIQHGIQRVSGLKVTLDWHRHQRLFVQQFRSARPLKVKKRRGRK